LTIDARRLAPAVRSQRRGTTLLEGEEGRKSQIVEGRSANHFELAFTESEFLLDFGQAYDTNREPLIHTRIIMTPRSAMTLARMMQEIVEQFVKTIGPIHDRQL
jgi:hypothetical protein